MARIPTVAPESATGKAKELLHAVHGKLGMVPNMMKTMAVAPTVLEGYLQLSGTLARGTLTLGGLILRRLVLRRRCLGPQRCRQKRD